MPITWMVLASVTLVTMYLVNRAELAQKEQLTTQILKHVILFVVLTKHLTDRNVFVLRITTI